MAEEPSVERPRLSEGQLLHLALMGALDAFDHQNEIVLAADHAATAAFPSDLPGYETVYRQEWALAVARLVAARFERFLEK